MTKYIGRKVEVGIGLESSRGSGITPAYALGKIDFSLYDKIVEARDEESLGHIADSVDKYVQEKYAQGSIGGNLGANSAIYLLALALGGDPSTGATSDSVTTHTVSVDNDNQHASAALLVKDGNQTLMHTLVMLESLDISVSLEDLVKWNAEFISKVARTSGDSMPSYQDDYKFGKRKAKIYIADAVGDLDAATRLAIKSFNITINKNLMRDSEAGTVQPTDILNQSIGIEGSIRLNYDDQTFKNYMLDGSRKALRVEFTSEKLIGSSTYGTVEIDLPKVDFFGWEGDSPNDDIVANEINFKANYDLTNGIVESCTVGNALSSL